MQQVVLVQYIEPVQTLMISVGAKWIHRVRLHKVFNEWPSNEEQIVENGNQGPGQILNHRPHGDEIGPWR